jgi:uncharacterized membrane protein
MRGATLLILLLALLPGISRGELFNFTTIDVPGATLTSANGINNSDQIVGSYNDSNGTHGFLKLGSIIATFDYPGASTTPHGINDLGQIVGVAAIGHVNEGFLKDGSSYTIVPGPGGSAGQVYGINSSGQVVGWYINFIFIHGFVKDGSHYTDILYPGSSNTFAYGINNEGDVVGQYFGPSTPGFEKHGSTYTRLVFPGATRTSAMGINDNGEIVENARVNGANVAFFLLGSTFNTLAFPGATSTFAEGVNNAGDIVGYYIDTNNVQHGFEAALVPEPSTCFLAGTASLIGLGIAWRRRPSSRVGRCCPGYHPALPASSITDTMVGVPRDPGVI